MDTGLLDGHGLHVTRARLSSAGLAAWGEVGVSWSNQEAVPYTFPLY